MLLRVNYFNNKKQIFHFDIFNKKILNKLILLSTTQYNLVSQGILFAVY